MSSYGKVKRSDPSDDSQREPLYYPTPYATTQLSTYGDSPNTSHCNTLRRHDGKGHEYDIPHRHAQVNILITSVDARRRTVSKNAVFHIILKKKL